MVSRTLSPEDPGSGFSLTSLPGFVVHPWKHILYWLTKPSRLQVPSWAECRILLLPGRRIYQASMNGYRPSLAFWDYAFYAWWLHLSLQPRGATVTGETSWCSIMSIAHFVTGRDRANDSVPLRGLQEWKSWPCMVRSVVAGPAYLDNWVTSTVRNTLIPWVSYGIC